MSDDDAATHAGTHEEDDSAMALPSPTDILTAGPGLVRLAAGVSWRMSTWALQHTVSATQRLVKAAMEGESVAALSAEAIDSVRHQVREIMGLEMDGARGRAPADTGRAPRRRSSEHQLQARGAELLARSADVRYEESAHPAYERILDELAPDEGRILRLLCQSGPQPSIDVRTAGTAVTHTGSALVAPGLSMIGPRAGVRYPERVPAYLNNLYRLGLVWFSRDPVTDLLRYQVLEAQPEVVEAIKRAGRARTIRRSIHLTPFGEDFCRTCLPPTAALPAPGSGPGTEPGTASGSASGSGDA